jgi:hypothetical protein
MSYAEKLEELQRLRAEVRRLEQLAEREAKSMRPITIDDERQMSSMQAVRTKRSRPADGAHLRLWVMSVPRNTGCASPIA